MKHNVSNISLGGFIECYSDNNIEFDNCILEKVDYENATGIQNVEFTNCIFIGSNFITTLENTDVVIKNCSGSIVVRYYNKNGEMCLR